MPLLVIHFKPKTVLFEIRRFQVRDGKYQVKNTPALTPLGASAQTGTRQGAEGCPFGRATRLMGTPYHSGSPGQYREGMSP